MKKTNRVRKPRALKFSGHNYATIGGGRSGDHLSLHGDLLTPSQAVRLAAWLISAAEYLEQEKRDAE